MDWILTNGWYAGEHNILPEEGQFILYVMLEGKKFNPGSGYFRRSASSYKAGAVHSDGYELFSPYAWMPFPDHPKMPGELF